MQDRVIVMDGMARSRLSLKSRLAAACYGVSAPTGIADGLAQLRAIQPRLAIMAAPVDDDPAELCRALATASPPTRLIALAPARMRLDLLQAGAAAVLSPEVSDPLLFATLRAQMRDHPRPAASPEMQAGLAEPAAIFAQQGKPARVALIADQSRRAMSWQRALQPRLGRQLCGLLPGQAVQQAAEGEAADLYVIAASLAHGGNGLNLMCELRARETARHAAYVIAAENDDGLHATALDLGASDILPLDPGSELACWVIQERLRDKIRADDARAEARRKLRLASTDCLTGLQNRHHATETLLHLATEARQEGGALGLLMIDLDRFKGCNEEFGHPAGDAVLQAVGARIALAVADQGIAARLGGDEFLVLLPPATSHLAADLAEGIRRAVAQAPIALPRFSCAAETRMTVSIGAARIAPSATLPAPDFADFLMETADRAEKLAKSKGGNRVELARSEMAWARFLPRATPPGLELSGSRT